MSYDLIIIGAGPAGLTAAIYARRACLKTLIFEKDLAGGKLNKTADVENYPGFTKISGPGLAEKIAKHALSYDVDLKDEEEVMKLIKNDQELFEVKTTKNETYFSKAVIVASGTVETKLKVLGEEEFTNFGVSYCAICDGYLFKGQTVAVAGGGYSALETALYMSNVASKVYLIHRRESFRAEKEIVEKVKSEPKIFFFLNSLVREIQGDKRVEKVIISSKDGEKVLEVKAVFPCVGLLPYSNFTHQLKICDFQNYIIIKEDCSTTIPGLFAAGDVARINQKKIKQIVTAVAEGAIAAQSVIKYLNKIK